MLIKWERRLGGVGIWDYDICIRVYYYSFQRAFHTHIHHKQSCCVANHQESTRGSCLHTLLCFLYLSVVYTHTYHEIGMGCATSSDRIHVGLVKFDVWHKPLYVTSNQGYPVVLYQDIDIRDKIHVKLSNGTMIVIEGDYPLMISFPHASIFILCKYGNDDGASILMDASQPSKLICTIRYATQSRYNDLVRAIEYVLNQKEAFPCRPILECILKRQKEFVTQHISTHTRTHNKHLI